MKLYLVKVATKGLEYTETMDVYTDASEFQYAETNALEAAQKYYPDKNFSWVKSITVIAEQFSENKQSPNLFV